MPSVYRFTEFQKPSRIKPFITKRRKYLKMPFFRKQLGVAVKTTLRSPDLTPDLTVVGRVPEQVPQPRQPPCPAIREGGHGQSAAVLL